MSLKTKGNFLGEKKFVCIYIYICIYKYHTHAHVCVCVCLWLPEKVAWVQGVKYAHVRV